MVARKLSIRGRLMCAFSVLGIVVLLVVGLAMKSLSDADERFEGHLRGINARLLMSYELRTEVDERAITARNLVLLLTARERETERAAVVAAHEAVGQRMAALKKLAEAPDTSADERRLVAEMERIEKEYAPVALAIVEMAMADKHDEAVEKMNRECRPLLAALVRAAHEYRDYASKRAARLVGEAAEAYAMQRNLLLLGCALAFAVAAVACVLITRGLMRALGAEPAELGAVARRVADGDLGEIATAAQAPQGSVLATLGEMQHSLARIVMQVRGSSDSIATGSAQIATGNADLSQRTEEQASNLQQTAASMEQIAVTVRNSADTAAEARRLAAVASQAAVEGGDQVGQVVGAMNDISASSKRIGEIIGVIDGIAFQTNILALNAAVEAARAGEQGRGFAVVASEVRNLAGRSAQAAKEIKGLIGASVECVDSGVRQVNEAGESMGRIVSQVQRVSQMIGELSDSAAQQSQGLEQVGDAVQQLDQVTQQNAALVEETAAAAQSLRHQAAQLAQAMNLFRLEGAVAVA